MQTELSLLVERMFALMYLVLGISLVVRTRHWIELIEWLRDARQMAFTMAFIALPFGLIIVLTHNIWAWSPSVIITIFGWSAVVKSVIYLLFPGIFMKLIPAREKLGLILRIEGVVLVILCGWLTVHTFFCGCA